MNPYLLILGLGYSAKTLAFKLLAQNFRVVGTSRNPDAQPKIKPPIELIDFNSPEMEKHLSQATHVLVSIPPINNVGDLVLVKYGELLKKYASHIQWLAYLSSTGVYGDHQGEWVNERTECRPHTASGMARLAAEKAWLCFAEENQLPLQIFRLSGIYGPGRNAIERIIQGKKYSIFKEGQVFCRIHVDDIASTLLASINSPSPLAIYNVSDDEPAPVHVVDQYACSLLNREQLPLILFSETPLSLMEQEFYSSNRRVSNLKIKEELKVALKYPSYKEGLAQLWNEHPLF
ncbi:SDR family oxidoreductase [Legionella sp. km772]|uniref:SDR family oxidoreductase n=1 Tax=Legionella sp. km772 TaxID=2498111 RepID=UPI000F8EE823|nr:SDR family oxidoreductase [Legionella sp. km772]RUR13056.1 SDR family oxidoreductase [Legionella sp. km772]